MWDGHVAAWPQGHRQEDGRNGDRAEHGGARGGGCDKSHEATTCGHTRTFHHVTWVDRSEASPDTQSAEDRALLSPSSQRVCNFLRGWGPGQDAGVPGVPRQVLLPRVACLGKSGVEMGLGQQ